MTDVARDAAPLAAVARPGSTAPPRSVSVGDARRALVAYQLARAPLAAVARRLGSVQVDPLAPLGRNHDLVLQARVDGYRVDDWHAPAYRDRLWLDAWDKQACLTLTEDWPARSLYHRHYAARWRPLLEGHGDAVEAVLRRVRDEGPRSALGFDDPPRDDLRGSWYGPRLVKHLLRALWDAGRLVTAAREAGRHVYDLPERSLPAPVRAAPPLDDAAALRVLLRRRVQAAGVLRRRAGRDLWSLPIAAGAREAALDASLAAGELEAWTVDGVAYLALPDLLDGCAGPAGERALAEASAPSGAPDPARVLGPLDNLLWDRRAVAQLFAFDYVWEVYKPAAQRRWGYYVVPVLVGERFVARFDGRLEGRAPRRPGRGSAGAVDGRLALAGWWWEGAPTAAETDAAVAGLARFLRYLGAEGVTLPRGLDRTARTVWRAAAAEARA